MFPWFNEIHTTNWTEKGNHLIIPAEQDTFENHNLNETAVLRIWKKKLK